MSWQHPLTCFLQSQNRGPGVWEAGTGWALSSGRYGDRSSVVHCSILPEPSAWAPTYWGSTSACSSALLPLQSFVKKKFFLLLLDEGLNLHIVSWTTAKYLPLNLGTILPDLLMGFEGGNFFLSCRYNNKHIYVILLELVYIINETKKETYMQRLEVFKRSVHRNLILIWPEYIGHVQLWREECSLLDTCQYFFFITLQSSLLLYVYVQSSVNEPLHIQEWFLVSLRPNP